MSYSRKLSYLLGFTFFPIFFTGNTMAAEQGLATVNGVSITQEELIRYERRRGIPADSSAPQQRAMMLEELINRELIYQDAIANGIDKRADVIKELELIKKNLYAGAMLKESADALPITDAELKAEYERQSKNMGNPEYKARHILLESEKDAKEVIAKLDKGANFAELAKEKSTGPSGPQGGDLGWFKPAAMVTEFSNAVAKLKDGEYSKAPVKTDFGWHVILRESSRVLEAPSFESAKGQIKMRLENTRIEAYIKSLREKAKIERK